MDFLLSRFLVLLTSVFSVPYLAIFNGLLEKKTFYSVHNNLDSSGFDLMLNKPVISLHRECVLISDSASLFIAKKCLSFMSSLRSQPNLGVGFSMVLVTLIPFRGAVVLRTRLPGVVQMAKEQQLTASWYLAELQMNY